MSRPEGHPKEVLPLDGNSHWKESPPLSRVSKRKRKSDEHPDAKDLRKKKAKSLRSASNMSPDLEGAINTAIGDLDSYLLADYVASKTRMLDSNLSSIELEEKHIPGTLPTYR